MVMDVKLSWLNGTSYEISYKQLKEAISFNIFTANDRYTNHLVYHPDLKPDFWTS